MSTVPRIAPAAHSANLLPETETEPALIRRERDALRELLRLVAERAAAEAHVNASRASTDAAADDEYNRSRQAMADRDEASRAKDRAADEQRRRAAIDEARAGEAESKKEFGGNSRRIAGEFDIARDRARNEFNRAKADVASGFDAGERDAARKAAEERKPIDDAARLAQSFRARLNVLAADYQKFGLADPPTAPTRESYERLGDPVNALFDRLTKVEKPLKLLEGLIIPKALKGRRFLWLFVIFFLLFVYPAVLLFDGTTGAVVALVAALGVGFAARTWLYALSKAQVGRLHAPLSQAVVDADALAAYGRAQADARLKERRAKVADRRDLETQQIKQKHASAMSAAEKLRDERLRGINEVYAQRMVEIQTKQQVEIREAIDSYERRKAEGGAQHAAALQRLDEKYRGLKQKLQDRHEAAWNALAVRWRAGREHVAAEFAAAGREADAVGPPWDDPSWLDRAFPRAVPTAIRFGTVTLDLERLPEGVSQDPRLGIGLPTAVTFAALRPFPARANLIVEAPAAGRSEALGMLQGAMFRLLTSLPPGLVRFTIVDPIGIGRNFGAFMHLADFDEALVTNQVWTEPRQIKDRLADLSAHMEKVTQKYLRNEYASIEEYNAVAGEVAEPYRVLVVADFPVNFDEESAARLAAIAAGGVPCGVLTMIALDRDRPLPAGVALADLRANALVLSWDDGRLSWGDPDFGPLALALDPPPPADFATRLIQRVGAAARDAKRVEVPFEFIAPAPGEWWRQDSRAGIDVPLGKAGATKRQNLTLGRGTSQHVLIAGRTGSGKSTLMHALITNLALNYSPDEIDLYLIDFKKGVEFKVYATHSLPHASVIAIESEREFGISVLQLLDGAMRDRADQFRNARVQDLNGFRNVPGAAPLPRMILIVDEFQEFFVEDDKLAQEAALLLDRLVRQGRAFGIHILLGSQSLGGAYALARSTLGQMAVRVALQCSETDASLILSENNTAARLLSRPGEAVYNDANGQPEGNHFFQVVWLADDRRESYLQDLSQLARLRPPQLARTPIVFEGDAPADLATNRLLLPLLDAPAWPASPRSARAWLGDPVAIKDPTAASFRRQGGNHLLIVGQNDEMALGIMTSALIGLAAQYPPATSDVVRSGARFAVLDGTPEDHPRADEFLRVAGALPHGVSVVGWRDAPRVLAEVAAEIARRGEPGAADGPEFFLFIHDLPRFRDFRRKADDFSFSAREEDAGPGDHLLSILRDGPGLGVHLLTWCDNLNNLNRVFDHQATRELGMRVLFQMSQTDSGHLLDAPHASKLGPHRALFASEESNQVEKFRPYGLASPPWLSRLAEQLRGRPSA